MLPFHHSLSEWVSPKVFVIRRWVIRRSLFYFIYLSKAVCFIRQANHTYTSLGWQSFSHLRFCFEGQMSWEDVCHRMKACDLYINGDKLLAISSVCCSGWANTVVWHGLASWDGFPLVSIANIYRIYKNVIKMSTNGKCNILVLEKTIYFIFIV